MLTSFGSILDLFRLRGLGELPPALLLLFPPLAVLFDLPQEFLLVGEQVGNSRVLLQLGSPFGVLLGELSLLALLCSRRLLDFVSQPDWCPLGLWLYALMVSDWNPKETSDILLGLLIEPAMVLQNCFRRLVLATATGSKPPPRCPKIMVENICATPHRPDKASEPQNNFDPLAPSSGVFCDPCPSLGMISPTGDSIIGV